MENLTSTIRCKAICLIINDNRTLVSEDFDTSKKDYIYCPLGGGIEFGERGEDTIKREFIEEINAEVIDIKYLTTIENIFVYNGNNGHELVRVYTGKLKDKSLYDIDEMTGIEESIDLKFKVLWKQISDFENNISILVPGGIIELLKEYRLKELGKPI